MAEVSYNQKLQDFALQCRHYYRMLDYMAEVEERNSGKNLNEDIVIELTPGAGPKKEVLPLSHDMLAYSLAKKQVEEIEEMFRLITEECGKEAHDVLWNYYVESEKADQVANDFAFSVRTLKRRISQWLSPLIDSLIPDSYYETYA